MNKNVAVAMSGGVDSSVAAALLVEQGFDAIGVTITPFKIDDQCRIAENERGCCNYKSVLDANDVCKKLGIEHKLVDLTDDFRENVVENFISEYMSGRTPNPCVICNPLIKWGGVISKADESGYEYIATGHYAKISHDETNNRYYISKGIDGNKDQSYFLWKLPQEQLRRTLFPLGDMVKEETRAIAEKIGLEVSKKPDSQEICFIPNNDYKDFLRKSVPDLKEKTGSGNIIFEGQIIGQHEGFPFYTIGQRKGLGVSHKEPLFVRNIDARNNVVEVGTATTIYDKGLIADNLNMMKYSTLAQPVKLTVKIRYKDPGSEALCQMDNDGRLVVEFLESKKSITPGQSVVLYEGNDLVGGGIIKNTF